ncbi:MAG: hypothetical protein ABI743_04270 [bacterium]
MTTATSEPIAEVASELHRPLPLALWAFDYFLAVLFIFAGPAYYLSELAQVQLLRENGLVTLLVLQLTAHFTAVYLFLTNHFVEPCNPTVRTVIAGWRLLILLWTVLCVLGFITDHPELLRMWGV